MPRFRNRRLGLDNSESGRVVDGMPFMPLSCRLVSGLTLYLFWGPDCGVQECSSTHLSAVVFLTECQNPQHPEERGALHVLAGPMPEGGVCVVCTNQGNSFWKVHACPVSLPHGLLIFGVGSQRGVGSSSQKMHVTFYTLSVPNVTCILATGSSGGWVRTGSKRAGARS